jgi:hypothetical protein
MVSLAISPIAGKSNCGALGAKGKKATTANTAPAKTRPGRETFANRECIVFGVINAVCPALGPEK